MTAVTCVIAMHPDQPRAGTATLTPVPEAPVGPVFLVTIDEQAADHFGISRRAGTVLGGIGRIGRLWSCTAYTDRAHLLHDDGDVWFLPDLSSRAQCARALARWWWLVDTSRTQGLQPPIDLTTAQWRSLIY